MASLTHLTDRSLACQQWIQNIRNNKNAKHSPRWAIKYGLVKDYRVKKTANGWSDRYGQGAADFQNQEVIIDPITGETRRDLDSGRNGNIRGGHSFPAPWSNNIDDSPRAEREDPYHDERRQRSGSSGRGHAQRDSVTGAIIDGGDNDGAGDNLHRTGSRRSLGSRYAERYGLGAADNSSKDSSSFNTNDSGSKGSSLWGSRKKKQNKKDRFAREADAMGDAYRTQSYDSFGDGPEEPTRYAHDRQTTQNRDPYARGTINDPTQDRHDF